MPRTPTSQEAAEKSIRLLLASWRKNQAWLAAEIGRSPFWLNRRLSGRQPFSVDDLDRIAAVFGLTLDTLLALADSIPGHSAEAAA